MKIYYAPLCALTLALAPTMATAQEAQSTQDKGKYVFTADYMADPAAHVFGGKLYIYPSHDWESGVKDKTDGNHYQMRDYHVLRMDGDPMKHEATDCGPQFTVDDVPWAQQQLWDNDCVEAGGKYHLIFSAKDLNGNFRLGVANADSPEGPFRPNADPIRGSYSIDPCVFKDDDGQIYVYFGGLSGGQLQRYHDNIALKNEHLPEGDEPALPSRVARMTADVQQFAEVPKPIVVVDSAGSPLRAGDPHRFYEASWMIKHNGTYYFAYSTGTSHLLCYASGQSPYGPFTYRGVLLEPVIGWTTHGCLTEYRGHLYLFYHDSAPSGGKSYLRSLKVKEMMFTPDGRIVEKK